MRLEQEIDALLKEGGASFQPALDKVRAAGVRFVIGASYVLRHHRTPGDLDCLVHKGDFDKLVKTGLGTVGTAKSGNGRVYTIQTPAGEVEMFEKGYPDGFDYHSLDGYDHDEHGNQTWTMEQLLKWKRAMGRPKDEADIKLIESLLKKK